MAASGDTLAQRVLAVLPQTQCTRCGYPDCAGYAQAIATNQVPINQCPPGGQEGVQRLAAITGQPAPSLNPEFGLESVRTVAVIDENWCIGCTLCIDACPTDAIIGASKRMHTVMDRYCTGCELCLPVCPVDCIAMENASGSATGWDAWSPEQAGTARDRYAFRSERLNRDGAEREKAQQEAVRATLADLAGHSRITDDAVLEGKRALIAAALARARGKAKPAPPK